MVNHCGNFNNVLVFGLNGGECHHDILLHGELTMKAHILMIWLLQGLVICSTFNQFTWTLAGYWSLRRFFPQDSEEGQRKNCTETVFYFVCKDK